MVQLIYKYAKCTECGKEGLQWGMEISFATRTVDKDGKMEYHTDQVFICHDCLKTALDKLDDMIEEAKYKTPSMNQNIIPISDKDDGKTTQKT